jgi:hypothetical protein
VLRAEPLERLEQPAEVLRRDARPGIADPQPKPAFDSMLSRICFSRCRSANTCTLQVTRVSPTRWMWCSLASGRIRSRDSSRTSFASTASGDKVMLPVSIREMSSTSLIRSSRCRPPLLI